jgi:carbon storage regulator CsrA
MLVLTRKAEQKIRIGNDIVITVLKVQGDQVSIGIEAPKELQIVREELLNEDLIKSAARENRKSALYKNRKIAEDFS